MFVHTDNSSNYSRYRIKTQKQVSLACEAKMSVGIY